MLRTLIVSAAAFGAVIALVIHLSGPAQPPQTWIVQATDARGDVWTAGAGTDCETASHLAVWPTDTVRAVCVLAQ